MERVIEGNFKRFVIEVLLVPENNNADFHVEDDGQFSEENYETSFHSETHVSDIEENKLNISEQFTKLDCTQLKFPKEETFSDSRDTEPASDSVINNSLSIPSSSHVEHCEFNLKNETNNSDNHTIDKLHNLKKNYVCAICNISFTSRASFKHHIKAHSIKIHQCTLCNYSSNTEFNLKNHIVLHNSINKQYKCNNCNFATNYKSNLTKHINNIHLKCKEYFCNICKQSFTTAINYAKHLSLHSAGILKEKSTKSNYITVNKLNTNYTNKQSKCQKENKCDICKYSCIRQDSFAKHMRLHSKGDPVHKCGICHYITDRAQHLVDHIQRHSRYEQPKCDRSVNSTSQNKESTKPEDEYSQAKQYKCNRCKYTSHFKNTVAKHIKLHLKGCFLHKCTICHFITDKQQHFENHVKTHLRNELPKVNNTLITCFQNINSPKVPMEYAKRKSYKCNFCKYSCPFEASFTKHMQLHSKGGAKYKCDICHYITDIRSHYTRHMMRHEQPKCDRSVNSFFQNKESPNLKPNNETYKCNICEHSCITAINFAKHMNLHSAEILKRKFTKSKPGNINEHMRTHCINKQSKYKCNICKYSCSREICLNKHLNLHSKDVVVHKCSICLYITDNLGHYVRHMKRHSKDKCNVSKSCSSDLRLEKQPSISSHKSIQCNYSCDRVDILQKHVKNNKFNCNICKFSTFHKDELSKHIKTHSKLNEYQCNICKHSCASAGNLTLHKRLHSIWNKCKHCNYFAPSPWILKKHLSKHSSN